MKEEQKISILIIALISAFFITTSIFLIMIPNSQKDTITEENLTDPNLPRIPRTSWYGIETSPISIDADATGVDAHNWTWAVSQDWCSGIGTENDPYLIENLTITVDDGSNPGLKIIDSSNPDEFFKLNNATIKNSNVDGDGLWIENCVNAIITSCNISANGDYGLYVENTNSSLFSSSYFNENKNGIYALDSNLNNFTVECSENTENGMLIVDCDLCLITNGQFINNTLVGLALTEDDDDSVNNKIYGNTFEGDDTAHDNCSVANTWDNDLNSGNTWDSTDIIAQGIVDADDDGIGDTEYDITGTANAQDRYPLLDDGDDIAPSISISKPVANSIHIYAPSFSVIITDTVGVDTRWYTLNGGSTNTTFTGNSGTIATSVWALIVGEEGDRIAVTITFYADDDADNIGSASVSIIKEIPEDDDDDNDEVETFYFNQTIIIGLTAISLVIFLLRRFKILKFN